jgi:hypothetical protein
MNICLHSIPNYTYGISYIFQQVSFKNSISLYKTENKLTKIIAHRYTTDAGWKCTLKYCKTLCKYWHFLSMLEVFPLIKSVLKMQLPCYSLVYLLCSPITWPPALTDVMYDNIYWLGLWRFQWQKCQYKIKTTWCKWTQDCGFGLLAAKKP